MHHTFRFDDFDVDPAAHRLLKRGVRIRLREQSFRVLTLLLARPGEVVTRDEFRHRLWTDDIFVDFDNSLNTAVGRLREALGDSADHPRYIETLPRIGYRFIATITEVGGEPASAARPQTRMLVLPFVNATGDAALEYFSDAITDDIITELSALAPATLGVIARTTSMHYKRTSRDVADIARELTLDWVVEGSVRRTPDRFALTAQLIRGSDQTHVLARRHEAPLDDIFEVERAVARAIGEQIGVVPDRQAQSTPSAFATRPPRQPTRNLIAYNYYIQGRQCLERGESPQSWAKAREYFEAAVTRDPEFALAHDALAELHWNTGFFALVPPREALAIGMPHALRAVEIDDRLAEAHAMLAQYRKQVEFDWDEVAREMARALELDPASPIVRRRHATTGLMPLGRLDEAVRELEVALDLDPLGLFSRIWLVVMLWLDRQYDRGIEQGRLLLEIEPAHFIAHLATGCVYREAGIFHEAIPALRRAADLARGNPLILGWLGLALAESGDASGARAVLGRLRALPSHVYVPPTSFAWIHIGLGEIDEFFEAMARAIDARDHMITPIKSYPFLDAVRGDRRYGDLLRKMNLA